MVNLSLNLVGSKNRAPSGNQDSKWGAIVHMGCKTPSRGLKHELKLEHELEHEHTNENPEHE